MDNLELHVWNGDWGLPSIDHHCLSIMAYCKFSGVPAVVNKWNNPWNSPSGELPYLKHENGTETNVAEIFNYLRKHNWGLDHDLSAKACSDIVAFTAVMEEKLMPALLHLWWVDSRTFLELTRPWYHQHLPFPLNFYLPVKKHKEYVRFLSEINGTDNLSESEREQKLYHNAKECLNLLSVKLGEKKYLFGDRPSSLDAIVFGYLVPLLKVPFPNCALQNHLKSCSNLYQMCQQILDQHFPLSSDEQAELQKQEENNKRQEMDRTEFPNRKRNILVAGAVSLTAMIGYAFLSGIIEIDLIDQKYSESVRSNTADYEHFSGLLDEEGGIGKDSDEKEQNSTSG